jgi:iron complex transport system permease protein
MLILVLLMAGKRGGENLLLSGVIAGTCASALLMYLVSVADKDDLAGITWWMLGDLQAVDIKLLIPALAVLTLFTAGARFFGRELNAVAMGDLEAWSMGVNPRTWKLIFIAAGSFLAAQTVAMAGLIAFAGLIVPHLVRIVYGCDHRYTAVTTALWGGVFLVIADTLARVVNPAHELPVGVLTSLLGGGLFIYLGNRKRGKIL